MPQSLRSTRPLAAILLLLACACGGADAGAEGDSANVVRSARRDGWSAERAWRLQVIGQIAGDEGPQAFGRVVDVEMDPLGRVWVADGMEQRIVVFNPDGRHVRTLGRRGGGPAEFMNLAGFAWAPDGTLWVVDGGNARFAVFDTAGTLFATHPRSSTLTVAPWPGGFDRQGRLMDLASRSETRDETRTWLARFGPGLSTADTLALPPVRNEFFGEITRGDARNRTVKQAPVPFTATQIWAPDPEGYAWVASSDRYRIERRGFDGTTERIVELENAPRRVSRADKDAILRNYRWFEEAGGTLDRSRIPDTYPHLLSFSFDDTGHLWVFPTYVYREKPRIDVFQADGRYLGQVQAPVPILSRPAPAFRGDVVAAVARDADGVDSILLMRLEKPAVR
jgi:6-bladed beta-propeller